MIISSWTNCHTAINIVISKWGNSAEQVNVMGKCDSPSGYQQCGKGNSVVEIVNVQ